MKSVLQSSEHQLPACQHPQSCDATSTLLHSQYSASPPAKSEEAAKASVVDVLDRASMAGQRRPLEDGSVPAPEPGAPAVRPALPPSVPPCPCGKHTTSTGVLRCRQLCAALPTVLDLPHLLVRKGQSRKQSSSEGLGYHVCACRGPVSSRAPGTGARPRCLSTCGMWARARGTRPT